MSEEQGSKETETSKLIKTKEQFQMNPIQLASAQSRFAECLRKAKEIVASYRAEVPEGCEYYNAETLPTDVIVPSIFTPYAIERTAQLSELWQSGIVEMNPQFAAIATAEGKTITMPFWQDLTGTSQPLSSTGALTTKKIVATGDAALIHERGDAWSDNDLAGMYAGSDPATAVGDLVADYWMRDMQTMVFSILKGVFAAASMSGNKSDIYLASGTVFTDANFLNGATFIKTQALMGDAAKKLVAIAMHSATYFALLANDLIDFIPESQGGMIATFRGLRIIVDDTMPVETINSASVYSTFLFGAGAFAYGVGRKDQAIRGRPGSTWETEFDRVSLAGQNIFINRRRFILHPRGVKWTDTVRSGDNASNADLENSSNWLRVYQAKNVRIVRVRHNVPA
jgi:hypothetical protein